MLLLATKYTFCHQFHILVQFLPHYMLNFRTLILSGQLLLSGQLAIPQGWPLNRGLIVYKCSYHWLIIKRSSSTKRCEIKKFECTVAMCLVDLIEETLK